MTGDLTVNPTGLKELVEKHLAHIESAWGGGRSYDWGRGFLNRFCAEFLDKVCMLGAEKLTESLTDGICHSTVISNSNTFICLSTFPCGLEEARQRYYATGYWSI